MNVTSDLWCDISDHEEDMQKAGAGLGGPSLEILDLLFYKALFPLLD